MTRERVLITGAGGFIGGHVAKVLAEDRRYDVVATARSSGAQFARLGVPLHVGNIGDGNFLNELVDSVDSVVHCAFGPDIDDPQALARLIHAAADAGAKRFVHLSTVEVYDKHEGTVHEDAPLTRATEGYGATKARLETCMREHADRFENTIILRPAIVYGPFCRPWTIKPLLRLTGGWKPDVSKSSMCNAVHVTDVARVIHGILDRHSQGVETYNVVGPDVVPWARFYGAFADAVSGFEPQESGPHLPTWLSTAKRVGMRAATGVPRPVQRTLLRTARTVPHLDLMVESLLRTHNLGVTDVEREVYRRKALYSTAALQKAGHRTQIPFDVGIRHTIAWAESMGLLGRPVTTATLRATAPAGWP